MYFESKNCVSDAKLCQMCYLDLGDKTLVLYFQTQKGTFSILNQCESKLTFAVPNWNSKKTCIRELKARLSFCTN